MMLWADCCGGRNAASPCARACRLFIYRSRWNCACGQFKDNNHAHFGQQSFLSTGFLGWRSIVACYGGSAGKTTPRLWPVRMIYFPPSPSPSIDRTVTGKNNPVLSWYLFLCGTTLFLQFVCTRIQPRVAERLWFNLFEWWFILYLNEPLGCPGLVTTVLPTNTSTGCPNAAVRYFLLTKALT